LDINQEKPKNPLLDKLMYLLDAAYGILLTYSQFVLLVIVVVVTIQVFSRKFLGTSIRWSEEVALFFMIWMAFISMAIGVQKGLHIAIGFFFSLLPAPLAKIVDKLDTLIIVWFGGFMMYYGSLLVQSTMSSTLPATHWPAGLEYLMIPVGGFFIVYFALIEFFGLQRYQHHQFYREHDESASTDDKIVEEAQKAVAAMEAEKAKQKNGGAN